MSETIRLQHEGKVLSVIMDRPAQKNALSIQLLREFCEILNHQMTDETAAVIISGAGGCFSAGADLSDLEGTIEDVVVDDAVAAAVEAIRNAKVPVIAAIDGPCLGAAVDLCLACDLRVASEGAYLQIPATRLGLLYNPKAVSRIAKAASPDTVFRLLVMGERFEAEEAYQAGLLSYPVSVEPSQVAALDIAERALNNDVAAMGASKRLLNALYDGEYDAEKWDDIRKKILASPERRAAVEAAKNR